MINSHVCEAVFSWIDWINSRIVIENAGFAGKSQLLLSRAIPVSASCLPRNSASASFHISTQRL